MIVSMYMSPDVVTIEPEKNLQEAVKLMRQRSIRRLVVVKNGQVVGIVCHRDVLQAHPVTQNPFSAAGCLASETSETIAEVMKSPVVTISPEEPIENATKLMTEKHIGGLVVMLRGSLCGMITESDVFRAFSGLLNSEEQQVRVTFELSSNEKVLDYLVGQTETLAVELLSFIVFENNDRKFAVARIRGKDSELFTEDLWSSGHTVTNILRN